ncbi:Radical S-adenosyl methionine domain-containing 2 protein [Rutstroemia sp. NJR-2017a BBW]|nr:Radical S-adenosyl methionine domain-containing 2 protein [Rutstroemia sp. NJR-2017a BBW]
MVILLITILLRKRDSKPIPLVPISVNYHLTRKCNYECGFCFHTAKTSYILPLEEAKRGLLLLKQAGMKKLNFAGGEPMMYPKFVGELARYCKTELGLESISIVTNGSLVKPQFLDKFGRFIDIIAVSCDSFDEATNVKIGRGRGCHLEKFRKLRISCQEHDGFVAEPNNVMKDSYLILDEYMRFLDKGNDPSASILEVGVEKALQSVFWDEKNFIHRGGIYDWTKETHEDSNKLLDW